MNMDKVLQNAIEVAVEAHRGQIRWDGSPFILHPMRVMLALETTMEKIVGILHDVLEDTDITPGILRASVIHHDIIIGAVELMTHGRRETYDTYIGRMVDGILGGQAPAIIAGRVKLEDLRDNMYVFGMDYSGATVPTNMLVKYHRAMRDIKGAFRDYYHMKGSA